MKVKLSKSCKPICYNLKTWNITQSPILLVTGLSGSGKTTFAKEFAKRHHAICISFDVLKFYPEASKQSKELLNKFLIKYPEIKKYILIQWSKTDRINSNDVLFNYYCNEFFNFLTKYCQIHKKKIVLEGIQMFVRLHPSKSVGFPIIIITTNMVNCFFNKIKRDYFNKNQAINIKFIKYLLDDVYVYYIKQRKLLNSYIMYLTVIYKNTSLYD